MTVLCSQSLFEILTFLVAVVAESFVGLVWEALEVLVDLTPLLCKKDGLIFVYLISSPLLVHMTFH